MSSQMASEFAGSTGRSEKSAEAMVECGIAANEGLNEEDVPVPTSRAIIYRCVSLAKGTCRSGREERRPPSTWTSGILSP